MSRMELQLRNLQKLEFALDLASNCRISMHSHDFLQRGLRLFRTAALTCLLGALPAAASITGVCPDGSMFIVNREADIPCPDAKQVDPHDMPPIRPAYLPRPHAWQIFQTQQDPNNPYNLVDRAREVREAAAPPPQENHRPALPTISAAPETTTPPRLDDAELRDLALIVGLSQDRLPAGFEPGPQRALRVDFAHSRAFEARLREHFTDPALGPVVVFSVRAEAASDFRANFTFVQGHVAYHPDPGDSQQLGILAGALGTLADGDHLLGYLVLPAKVDLSQPTDVYWNDRRISVALLR